MKATNDDIAVLNEIQSVNQQIAQRFKVFEELPEKGEYVSLSTKASEIEEKLSKIREMNEDANSRYDKLLVEDSQLQDREDSVQRSIDEAAGDYRNLEVRTKELDGIATRRSLLSDMILKVDEERSKTKELIKTTESALLKIETKMVILSSKISSDKKNVEESINEFRVKLEDLYEKLPDELEEVYKKASQRVGSVVLSSLEGDRCAVCRSTLETGTLFDLERAGNIGICPYCERILIIEKKEE